jgi:capsular polysaccharide export protein
LKNNYFLVPLQMPGDSQLAEPANGWTLDRLIEGVLAGLAKRPAVARIVFKFHPLDGDTRQRSALIRRAAERHGLTDKVTILHSGSMAELAAHSAGMIIINSSSGLVAIEHGVPLLMLGDGVFRNEHLVTCGADEGGIAAFFAERWTAPADLRRAYLDFLAANALIPGDFYKRQGIAIGVRNLAARLLAAAGQPAPAEQEPAA